MVNGRIINNAKHIDAELHWLSQCLNYRIQKEFKKQNPENGESNNEDVFITPPILGGEVSAYSDFVTLNSLTPHERLMLMIVMAAYFKPQMLDVFLVLNSDFNKSFTEFGGAESKQHKGFIPTGQTLLFLLAGNNLEKRFSCMRLLEAESTLIKDRHILLEGTSDHEPFTSGTLVPSRDLLELFTKGEHYKPLFNSAFPAKQITTGLEWNELILPAGTKFQLEEIDRWLKHHHTLMNEWEMSRKLKPGYRALFYGPPGTGKTLTASLIGKNNNREVYRIDLSKVVSKYIGETEKNLARIFDRAENKSWILFFDEADALFGKRTKVDSSNDRHANQETAYLLQRIEDYNGLVILATNMKSNIDDAFMRRFQSVVYFPIPKKEERLVLWKNTLPSNGKLDPSLNIENIAEKYELAGGTIINIVQYSSLKALNSESKQIIEKDVLDGIKMELGKMGKTI